MTIHHWRHAASVLMGRLGMTHDQVMALEWGEASAWYAEAREL